MNTALNWDYFEQAERQENQREFKELEREAYHVGLKLPLTHHLSGSWSHRSEPRVWSINGHAIDLTQREFLVVYILLKTRHNNGGFTSIHQMLEEIKALCGDDFWSAPSEAAVRRAVSGLRKKLKWAGFADNVIRNKHSAGYRIEALRGLIFIGAGV